MASFKRLLDYLEYLLLVVWAGGESRLSRRWLWIWPKCSQLCTYLPHWLDECDVSWFCCFLDRLQWLGNAEVGTLASEAQSIKRVECPHVPAFEKVSVVLGWWDLAGVCGCADSTETCRGTCMRSMWVWGLEVCWIVLVVSGGPKVSLWHCPGFGWIRVNFLPSS